MFGCGECENRKSSQISLIKLVLGVHVVVGGCGEEFILIWIFFIYLFLGGKPVDFLCDSSADRKK